MKVKVDHKSLQFDRITDACGVGIELHRLGSVQRATNSVTTHHSDSKLVKLKSKGHFI